MRQSYSCHYIQNCFLGCFIFLNTIKVENEVASINTKRGDKIFQIINGMIYIPGKPKIPLKTNKILRDKLNKAVQQQENEKKKDYIFNLEFKEIKSHLNKSSHPF